MIRAERCPVNWSRTIAREIAIPAATPMPWSIRPTTNHWIVGESAAITPAGRAVRKEPERWAAGRRHRTEVHNELRKSKPAEVHGQG